MSRVRVSFAAFQVVREIAFLCKFDCIVRLIPSTFVLLPCGMFIRRNLLYFFQKSLLRILHNSSLVIHGDHLLRIRFDLSEACLSTQLNEQVFPFLPHIVWIRMQTNINPWHLLKISQELITLKRFELPYFNRRVPLRS